MGSRGGIMVHITRRQFLTAATGAGALAAFGGVAPSAGAAAKTPAKAKKPVRTGGITDPKKAPFDTVVVLMMENRSFDHLLGWMPGVNGKQAGLKYPDLQGKPARTAALGCNPQACGDKDPAHDWKAVAKQYNNGKCNGWLQTQTTGDHFPIGYYEKAQVPMLGTLASNYTLFDNYHCSL